MGWLIFLAILVLLAILPLGASVLYDADGPRVRIVAGPLKIQVFPMKKKPKKDKPKKEKPKKEQKKPAQAGEEQKPFPKPKTGGSWTDFLPLVQVVLDLLNDLRRKLRINELKLHLTLAGDDPCDLAVNYGRMNASLAALIAQLERVLVIKKRDVHIDCDFTANETVILARLDLTITLGRILAAVFKFAFRALVEYLKIMKKRKGGAAK